MNYPTPPTLASLRAQLRDPTLARDAQFIGGEWCGAMSGKRHEVINPATQELVATVPFSAREDTVHAIRAATLAQRNWGQTLANERAKILRRWRDLIVEHSEDLGLILATEQGKPIRESVGEVLYGASFIEWFAEEAKRVYGDVIPTPASSKRIVVVKQPVGVVGLITPWNFPSAMISRKAGPALASGCAVVLKPAEATPLSALALAELAQRAGVPPGVFNVVTTGDPQPIGEAMCAEKSVRKISFTGSTRVGKLLMERGAHDVKRMSMELGGNAAFIVFADADIDAAVQGLMAVKFRNTGQTCISANRIYVHQSVTERFVGKLSSAMSKLVVGDPIEATTTQGPLINQAALNKVERLVADAKAKGADLVMGGKRHQAGPLFYAPTILTSVPLNADLNQEEIFGPVAAVSTFTSDDEAVALANETDYGLANYFYSRDVGRAWRIAERLESGMVGVNEAVLSTEVAPFGGVKHSGIGREGSRYGIADYVETKYICFGGI
jgi:succinate-semialdehyde dehydrogenase / glutarate-semialdehyde dehydrogenase